MRKLFTALALAGALIAAGCAGFTLPELSPTTTATARVATKLGVQIGVLQYVGEDVAKAQQVKAGAETVKALIGDDTGEPLDIFEVQKVVNDLIDEFVAPKQTPQQVLLLKNAATLIVVDIDAIIRERGGVPGVLTPDLKERVNFYLDAVIEAVDLVIGPQTAGDGGSAFGIDRVA